MLCGYIPDKLLNEDCLTNSGSTEETDLTTLRIRSQKVDYLDTCLEHLDNRTLLLERRRLSVNYPVLTVIK